LGVVVACTLTAGCQSYAPLPLPARDDLATGVDVGTRHGVPGLASNGSGTELSLSDAAYLTVVNNPDLKAAVDGLRVANAKLYDSHLFPDPQLTWSIDFPLEHMAGIVAAYGIVPSYDIQALVLHRATILGAEASRRQAILSIQWQAWQLAQKARDLFIQGRFFSDKLLVLQRETILIRQDYEREKRALASGDVTSAAVSADLVALTDADRDLRPLRRQIAANHIARAAVMGVRPVISFRLAPLDKSLPPNVDDVNLLLASLPQRRPDLLALRAGYDGQEAAVRRAILAQFPSLSLGINRARDNTSVNSIGPAITMTLPLFNRNRGQIATEEATREQLRGDYQARIDQSISDVRALQSEIALLRQEIPSLEWAIKELRGNVERARHGFETGDFPALSFVSMQTSLYAKELELLDRRQAIWQSVNNIATLLGDGPPELAAPWNTALR
jgi:cobalt-zinc-cadmium efflux system outer membrane protein